MWKDRSPGSTQISVGRETEALLLKLRTLPLCNSAGFPRGPGGNGDPKERSSFLRWFWDGEEKVKGSTQDVLAIELTAPPPPEVARTMPVSLAEQLSAPNPGLISGSEVGHLLRAEVGKGH